MKTKPLVAALLAALLFSGCASFDVAEKYDEERKIYFAQYIGVAWANKKGV